MLWGLQTLEEFTEQNALHHHSSLVVLDADDACVFTEQTQEGE